jgi:hypothetical protein
VSRVYCSDAARLRGDDNTATAARIDIWILVEFPGTWGRDPLRDAALPPAVAAALRRAGKEIPRSRIVFIRRRLDTQGANRVYVVRSAPYVSQSIVELTSIDAVADIDFVALAAAPAMAVAQPLILVCTHGQHDSCCGRRGYPLYDALRQHEDLDVWQCSHIGGDRFAANAVVLPWGIYYGPVELRDSDLLLESVQRGEIFLSAYRGRSSMARVEQAAETFVRRDRNLLSRDSLHLLTRESLGAERTRVQLQDDAGTQYDVLVEQYAVKEALLTCMAKEENPIPQFRLIDLVVVPR